MCAVTRKLPALLCAAVCAAGAAVVLALLLAGELAGMPTAQVARGIVAGLAYGVLGAAVAIRQRRSPVGWLMLVIGLSNAVSALLSALAHVRLVEQPGEQVGGLLYWLGSWTWVPGYTLIPGVLLLLLPAGRALGPRWLAVARLGVGVTVLATVGWALTPYDAQDVPVPETYGTLTNPLGVAAAQVAIAASLPLLAACAVTGLASLLVRMRRATGREREQAAWVLAGALLTVALLVLGFLLPDLSELMVTAAMVPIPAAIGWATVRRRLADVDPLVNRGLLSVAILVCALGVYALVLAVAGDLLRDLTQAPDLVAFVVAAAAVQPLTFRLQRVVNRLLYGVDVEPHLAVARLGAEVQSASSGSQSLDRVAEVVAGSLGSPYAGVSSLDGTRADHGYCPAEDHLDRRPLLHQGRVVGELAVAVPPGGYGRRERELLDQLSRHAALAAHAVTLQEEVQRSREQIVGSREEERRRLRHDLHDDLGPGLAATALALENAADLVEGDPGRARRMLERAAVYLRSSVAEVRRIVDDLRPTALGELGLVSAVREHAGRLEEAGMTVTVTTRGELEALPAAAEVAAYRIVTEALTNVVRHARAEAVEVTIARVPDGLAVAVRDDGVGLAPAVDVGVGLDSMHQRAAELGGRCTVAAGPSGGTIVDAWLPMDVG